MKFYRVSVFLILIAVLAAISARHAFRTSPSATSRGPYWWMEDPEPFVRDQRLRGTWYTVDRQDLSDGATSTQFIFTKWMLRVYDDERTEYAEFEITRNDLTAEPPQLDGVKIAGRRNGDFTGDVGLSIRMTYAVRDDTLQLDLVEQLNIRPWPGPSSIRAVRVASSPLQ